MENKKEMKVITEKQKKAIMVIQKLLNEMHKDINELMNFENLKVASKKHDIVAINIGDKREKELPMLVLFPLKMLKLIQSP